MLLSMVLLYATLLGCAIGIGWLVFRYDLHEKEPVAMLVLAVLLGAGAMSAAGRLQVEIITRVYMNGGRDSNALMAALAGITEETAKFAVVVAIALFVRKFFNEPVDGLIYGSFAGLGAALEESVSLLTDAHTSSMLPMGEPIRLAGHLLMGGIGGYGVGLLVGKHRWAWAGVVGCLLGAVALHTAWDLVAFDAADVYRATQHLHRWHAPASIGLMVLGMVAYRNMVSIGVRLTGEAPERIKPGA